MMTEDLTALYKYFLVFSAFLCLNVHINAASVALQEEKTSNTILTQTDKYKDNKVNDVPKKEEKKINAITYTGEVAFQAAKLPNDTFVKLIAEIGKDSLLNLVNNRIIKAVKFLNYESKLLSDEFQIAELLLYSKHFKLGFDTLNYPNFQLKSIFYRLYDKNISNPAEFFDTIVYRKKSKEEIGSFFQENINNRAFRIGIAAFSNYLNFPQKTFDTLYQMKTRLSIPEQIELYFIFTEFVKNNPEKNSMLQKDKSEIYQYLYKNNNIINLTEKFALDFTDEIPLINTYRLLAYGLYGKEIFLSKNAMDLMYILSLQYPDGGWRNSFNSPVENMGDRNTTIYALWALCEFKEQLLKLKDKP